MVRLALALLVIPSIAAGLVVPSTARAQAFRYNLAWDDCILGGGRAGYSDPCNLNFGPITLVVSLEVQQPVSRITGATGTLWLTTEGELPDYWRLDPGGCRAGRMLADAGIGSVTGPLNCAEAWSGAGGAAAQITFAPAGFNRARLDWTVQVPGQATFDPSIHSEWYLLALRFNRGGTTTCAGCQMKACFESTGLRLTRSPEDPGGHVDVTVPGTIHGVVWQGYGYIKCGVVHADAQNATWGRVKGLFR